MTNLLYTRFPTREVRAGSLGIGGKNPIRIQSMLTANTLDTLACVKEAKELFDAGCELVRLTAQGPAEAQNLKNIKEMLLADGYTGPLSADIHFSPRTALIALEHVEKVRINPGNYIDKKNFKFIEYTEAQYQNELNEIVEALRPLVNRAKELGRCLRIGTNHGSLSDRIMSRYGDTPEGMVESAMEFLRACEYLDFKDIVVSMKSSNPVVMIRATRLLVENFIAEQMSYPLHLGVTEAGEGIEGRIKSAAGIGALLEDGLGDTIRVSLTEKSVKEIPAARALIAPYEDFHSLPLHHPFREQLKERETIYFNKFRNVKHSLYDTSIIVKVDPEEKPPATIHVKDYLYIQGNTSAKESYILRFHPECRVLCDDDFIILDNKNLLDASLPVSEHSFPAANDKFYLVSANISGMNLTGLHRLASTIPGTENKLVLRIPCHTEEDACYLSPAICAGLLPDLACSALLLDSRNAEHSYSIALTILQALRIRITKADFISCPSCGRTEFDLEETTAKIKARLHHLKGIKIAVMGCIVNGPGEMADADFGYVGASHGKIHLYKGMELVKKNIPSEHALDELISLMKEAGVYHE